MQTLHLSLFLLFWVGLFVQAVAAQETGAVRGEVVLAINDDPVVGAVIRVVGQGIQTKTNPDGSFLLGGVPVGTHQIEARRKELSAQQQTAIVQAGETTQIRFSLTLAPIQERITVTGGESSTFETISPVTTLESHELTADISPTLGEVLEDQAGISKRYFGPGSARPIIRGFDGDRVLIMEDGIRTGDISSQSGAHGISVDPSSYQRIEIIRGPATLLYGTNAVGGVVNLVSPQDSFDRSPPKSLQGHLTFDTGSANSQAGITGDFQYGENGWGFWGGGTGRRTDDYHTPEGRVQNSQTRMNNARVGFGYFGGRSSFSIGYGFDDGRFGVPFAGELHALEEGHSEAGAGHAEDDHGEEGESHHEEGEGHAEDEGHDQEEGHDEEGEQHGEEEGHHDDEPLFIDLDQRRHAVRFNFGLRELSNRFIQGARFALSYIDWAHDEFEIVGGRGELASSFDNDTFVLRAEMEQRTFEGLSGKFGFWGQFRDYKTAGVEALAPPVTQDALAAFTYQELRLTSTTRLEFGARLEHNKYAPLANGPGDPGHIEEEEAHPEGDLEPPEARPRSFTGVSGSLGIRHQLSENFAFVTKVSRSYRAPALEELYNFGPHVDNLAFEVGDPDLEREAALGWDASLKLSSDRAQGNFNFFVYDIDNFIFPGFTTQRQSGLLVAPFQQGDSRFVGFDAEGEFELNEHLWLQGGVGYVWSELSDSKEALPRIPPLHGFLKVGIPYRGFTLAPEVRWATEQDRIFRNETSTAGYGVVNINASYVLPSSQFQHVFAIKAYNLTNKLYRNHTSLIKDLAPEIGRGIKMSYSLHFF